MPWMERKEATLAHTDTQCNSNRIKTVQNDGRIFSISFNKFRRNPQIHNSLQIYDIHSMQTFHIYKPGTK